MFVSLYLRKNADIIWKLIIMIHLRNNLLNSFSVDERVQLFPYLKLVNLPLGTIIYEPYQKREYVYFPIDCIISTFYVTADGASAEISIVGNEGISDIACFMGGESTLNLAVVQSEGFAYRLSAAELRKQFNNHTDIRAHLLSYTQSLIVQISQTAVCNRHHSIQQRLCRWLLLSLDRISSNNLTMTHELIASMLGVRREGVTEAAGKLQKLGAISYARGHIKVLDRAKLEFLSCECYEVVKNESARIDNKASIQQQRTSVC